VSLGGGDKYGLACLASGGAGNAAGCEVRGFLLTF
jgi:hypothetical protein